MQIRNRATALKCGLLCVSALVGCATERAHVSFSYVVDAERGLPPGMKRVR